MLAQDESRLVLTEFPPKVGSREQAFDFGMILEERTHRLVRPLPSEHTHRPGREAGPRVAFHTEESLNNPCQGSGVDGK